MGLIVATKAQIHLGLKYSHNLENRKRMEDRQMDDIEGEWLSSPHYQLHVVQFHFFFCS